jgi:hypothetical protein
MNVRGLTTEESKNSIYPLPAQELLRYGQGFANKGRFNSYF